MCGGARSVATSSKSSTDKEKEQAWREALTERNAQMDTAYYLLVTEEQAYQIAAGIVPPAVMTMARYLLDLVQQDARNAEANQILNPSPAPSVKPGLARTRAVRKKPSEAVSDSTQT